MNDKQKSELNIITFSHGLLMGAADAVPGVSGGTIALILGIYSKLIKSLSNCLIFVKDKFPSKTRDTFISSFTFLFTLGIGMFFSYFFITKLLVNSDDSLGLLEKKSTAPYVYSFFFGLVLFSIKEPWSLVIRPKYQHYFLFLVGIFVIFFYVNSSFNENAENKSLLILSGAFALTAMLLPGISGALVLLTLGQYTLIASSFHDLDFGPLFYFFLGGLIGLILFVPIMNYAMTNFLDYTMSLLTGLMCGSLITLWPWKENYEVEGLSPNLGILQVLDSFTLFSLFLAVFCFGLGAAASFMLKIFEQKTDL